MYQYRIYVTQHSALFHVFCAIAPCLLCLRCSKVPQPHRNTYSNHQRQATAQPTHISIQSPPKVNASRNRKLTQRASKAGVTEVHGVTRRGHATTSALVDAVLVRTELKELFGFDTDFRATSAELRDGIRDADPLCARVSYCSTLTGL
jgi:hypothetical protein